MATAFALAIALLGIPAGMAQSRETFDVTSVKVNVTGLGGEYPGLAPGGQRFMATRQLLVGLIMIAYGVPPGQIVGIPDSFKDFYDVEGQSDHPMTKEQARRMFQALLEDRFKLSVHRETRQQPVYALVVAQKGSKLVESAEDSGLPDIRQNALGFVMKRTPITTVTMMLSQVVHRPILDKTGLTGRYDFTLHYSPERGEPNGFPSIFTALPEQLGLKLESQKGPVDFIVVDHAEQPTRN